MRKLDPGLMVVLVTITINMMGVGIAWPVLPRLVQELTDTSISHAAYWVGAIFMIFSLAQFVFAPIMGALSDRFGRRPIMLICLIGLGLDMIFTAIAPNVWLLFLARFLGGVFASTMVIANAYIADTFKREDRAGGFGLIGVAFGIGFIIGPLLGGVLGNFDIRLPFYVAAAISLANVVLGYFFLRESLPPENRNKEPNFNLNPLRSLSILTTSTLLLALAGASFLANLIQRGLESIWVLFTQFQYGWEPNQTGASLAIVGASYIFAQGFLVKRLVRRFGELQVVVTGFFSSAVIYSLLSINTNSILGFLGIIPHVIGWACATPALQAIASGMVNEKQQGTIQGAFSSINGLAAIIGPAGAAFTFGWFSDSSKWYFFPGAFFAFGSIMLLAAALIAKRYAVVK